MFKVAIAIAVVLAILAVVGAVWWARSREQKPPGFMEYVKDPAAWKARDGSIEEYFAAIEEEAKKPAEELVDGLIVDADMFGMPARAIREAGPATVPALLAAINDPRFREFPRKSKGGRQRVPIEGVLDCLEEFVPREAVRIVAPLASDDNKEIRKRVALLLGAIASDEAAPLVVDLLNDDDSFVRTYAVMGIGRAVRAGRVEDEFRRIVFEALVPVAFADGDDAPACLLGLDKVRATSILTHPEKLTAEQPCLYDILEALREAGVAVEEDVLLKLLSDLQSKDIVYAVERSVTEILMLLASQPSERAHAIIGGHAQHSSQRIREGAAEARLLAQGLGDPLGPVWDKLKLEGWQGLTEPQRHVLAVRILIDEVNNGGFLQYFVNSSGDQWLEAAEGLDAIGATGDRQLFDKVLAFFKDSAPSEKRDERHEQVAVIANKQDQPFDDIESQFYKDADSREVLLNEYILKNAGDFGANAR